MKVLIKIFAFCGFFQFLIMDTGPSRTLAQIRQDRPSISKKCDYVSIDFVKTLRSGDEFGNYFLSFASFSTEVYENDCIFALVDTLKRSIGKKRMKVFLFDNIRDAEKFSKGKIRLQDLEMSIRGMYYRDKKTEYIKYSPEKGKPWDAVTIKIH